MIAAIRRNVTWRAIPFAGLAAGTVMLIAALILLPVVYEVPATLSLQYFASLVLGSSALMDPGIGVLLVGVLVHYVLSILAALVIAIVIHRWGFWVGVIGGALLGVAIYVINFYTMTSFWPWLFVLSGPVMLAAHALFGAVVGAVYESFDHFDLPLEVPLKETPNV